MQKRYTFAHTPSSAREALGSYSDLLQSLLHARNITSEKQAGAFLNPDYEEEVHDPFLMRNMDTAVARIMRALDEKEHIAVYHDFDADGICGGVVLHDLFAKIGVPEKRFTSYIPHRHTEGYGFHAAAVDTLKEKGVTLIVTADVGTASPETVLHAQQNGIDVIITDHHKPTDGVPDAYAVLNPQQDGETYPFPHLCGTGVAFKLAQALLKEGRSKEVPWASVIPEGWEKWLLDVVAIATVADMMPLVGENRALVHWGLVVLRKSPRLGIQLLAKKVRLRQHVLTEDDIGFSIAPRLNAASRMAHPELGFTLLTTRDAADARDIVNELEQLNNQRKGHVAQIVKEITARCAEDERPVFVAGNPNWNPALLGLVANSLVDTYGKTVCLWGREGTGALKGSCRGDGSVDVTKLLHEAREALVQFGGHEHAGGFSVLPDAVHTLAETFSTAHEQRAHKKSEEVATQVVDAALELTRAPAVYREVARLRPFGIGNERPVFVCERVQIDSVSSFGSDGAHLEVRLCNERMRTTIRAIAFFTRPESLTRAPVNGETVTVLATLEESHFGGRTNLELRIVDIV